jgi:hypothetical protein
MATVTITTGTSYQTIDSWEATHQAGESSSLPSEAVEYPSTTFPNYKDELLDELLDFGINRIRIEMRYDDVNAVGYSISSPYPNAIQPSTATAGQWHYDRIDQSMDSWVTDYRDMLTARGEELHINLCFVDFRSAGYQAETVATEAALVIKNGVQHFYTTYGYLPDSIEPCLEPDNQTGGGWTAARLANIIVQARSDLAALDTGGSPGYGNIPFIAPSPTDGTAATTWWSDMKTAQATIPSLVSELSYHSYTAPSNAQRDAIFTAANTDGVKTSMLEFISASYDMLYDDLTRSRVSSWQQFTSAYTYVGWVDNGAEYFTINTTTWAVTPTARTKWLRHLFKYVRRGAVRKEASCPTAGFTSVIAFENANGTYVVVLRNTLTGVVNVTGLPAGTYGINYSYGSSGNTSTNPTTYDASFANQTIAAGQDVSFTMADAGIATVFDITYLDQPPADIVSSPNAFKLLMLG